MTSKVKKRMGLMVRLLKIHHARLVEENPGGTIKLGMLRYDADGSGRLGPAWEYPEFTQDLEILLEQSAGMEGLVQTPEEPVEYCPRPLTDVEVGLIAVAARTEMQRYPEWGRVAQNSEDTYKPLYRMGRLFATPPTPPHFTALGLRRHLTGGEVVRIARGVDPYYGRAFDASPREQEWMVELHEETVQLWDNCGPDTWGKE